MKKNYNDFLDRIGAKFGQNAALSLKEDFFDSANLPLPENRDQWLNSADSGVLLFMEDPCIVLRIRSHENKLLSHPNILAPIEQRTLGEGRRKIVLEFIPGVKLALNEKDVEQAKKALYKDGFDYWDDDIRNTGILPDGTPVVIDFGAVEKLNTSTKDTKRLLETNQQETLFCTLKDAFNKAWPKSSSKPIDMKPFWQACVEEKNNDKLNPGWQYYFYGNAPVYPHPVL